MARLRRGFEVLHDEAEAQADEQAAEYGTSDMRRKAANPHRGAPGRVRPGDEAALDEFASKHNLRKN